MGVLGLMALGLFIIVKSVCECIDSKAKEVEFEKSGKKMFY